MSNIRHITKGATDTVSEIEWDATTTHLDDQGNPITMSRDATIKVAFADSTDSEKGGCDFYDGDYASTDLTLAAAIAALPTGGGLIQLATGTGAYGSGKSVNAVAGLHVMGCGENTLLTGGASAFVFGNGDNHCRLSDFKLTNFSRPISGLQGTYSDIKLIRLHIDGGGNDEGQIRLKMYDGYTVTDLLILDCLLENSLSHAINFSWPGSGSATFNNLRIIGNTIRSAGDAHADCAIVGEYVVLVDALIGDNYIYSPYDCGIYITAPAGSYGRIVHNRVIDNAQRQGAGASQGYAYLISGHGDWSYFGNLARNSEKYGFVATIADSEITYDGDEAWGCGVDGFIASGTFASGSRLTYKGVKSNDNNRCGINCSVDGSLGSITAPINLSDVELIGNGASLTENAEEASLYFYSSAGSPASHFRNLNVHGGYIAPANAYQYAIRVRNNTAKLMMDDVNIYSVGRGISLALTADSLVRNNLGYIASGEERIYSGTLTAGNANAFAFAWQNPHAEKIIVTKVVIDVTTAGGTAGSVLAVGTGASATTASDNILDDDGGIDLNAAAVYNSIDHAGTNGIQGQKMDENGGTTDYVTGQILTENAASLVGKYYIYYTGV